MVAEHDLFCTTSTTTRPASSRSLSVPTSSTMRTFAPSATSSATGAPHRPKITDSCQQGRQAHALGAKWMAPVSFQDSRPYAGNYAEASNTGTAEGPGPRYRGRRGHGPDDHLERLRGVLCDGSVAWPTAGASRHRKYYITRFKSGSAPAITQDHLYVTNRRHFVNSVATSGIMNMRNGFAPG